jgi:RHH-type proline utilization regulon transcriptional repressor/proline dehydrogenase/delta 1-pyrroline-5-carboxylate dehydrogenase
MPSDIEQAKTILNSSKGHTLTEDERCQQAIELAGLMLTAANDSQTSAEKKIQSQLARMMKDPVGKTFTTTMTDQCFRSQNPKRIANQLVYTIEKYGVPHYLTFDKKLALQFFKLVGNRFPEKLVPLTKSLIRRETSRVILPGEYSEFSKHMQQRREQGIRINLNHLGEAILGENEAQSRLNTYLEDLANPQIEYISIKISTICSQINLLAWEETLTIITDRLKQLYRAAKSHQFFRQDGTSVPKFVNLDMEEYRDLRLTVEAFCKALDSPEFFHHSAGIVLQSYLPDSFSIQKELTEWAQQRISKGGAPIKIRIVKGANLAMEKVEASLRGWPQAPYMAKGEVDANFKRMISYACHPKHAEAAHIGIGSHNLFDIAYSLLLRAENLVESWVNFEMLEGMADHMRRIVQELSGEMLLYCPIAEESEFQNAVAYLIRRLDENTAPENFLRQSFNLRPGTTEWEQQANLFCLSCRAKDLVSHLPRRDQNRFYESAKPSIDSPFVNEPDTDWSLPQNRHWAEAIINRWANRQQSSIPLVVEGNSIFNDKNNGIGEDPSYPGKTLFEYSQASEEQAKTAISASVNAQTSWAATPISKRSEILAEIAQGLRRQRGTLIGAMIANTGKTIPEADPEVSEAIDFAEFYRRNAEELYSLEDIRWSPKGTVLVAPPWNFPCSIPAGSILAALVAGNCVIFKPAPEAVLVGWELAQIFWDAGISKEVLQFLPCEDDPVGSLLVKDPRISAIILTGSTATAKLMLKLRSDLDLIAETGGKNAMIITNLSDRDLAVKDLVQSAFGHSGQKCSACSLAICEAEVYDDPQFRAQLRDAAASLKVGSQWNLANRINPLIHAPNPTLLRGLTSLEESEEWLLEPKQDPNNPNCWSPGIKLGVQPESFTHQNELFGPVLGIMRANNLEHAVNLANDTSYGLTAGLHSLDEREHAYWISHIVAGNCYINRGTTGAIVQRQPFGGCKESSFGRGAKAGGPNYVLQLMHPKQVQLPTILADDSTWDNYLYRLIDFFESSQTHTTGLSDVLKASIGNYLFFWQNYFSQEHDPSYVLGEDNLFYYVPRHKMVFRVQPTDDIIDVLRVIAAAHICNAQITISLDPSSEINLTKIAQNIISETENELIARIENKDIDRIRFLSKPSAALQQAIAHNACNAIIAPVLENGRIELLNYLREVSLSFDYHRYGNLGARENELRGPCDEKTECCGSGSCCG